MKIENIRFLVVEDNDLDVERVERTLANAYVEATLIRAKDGIDALEILRGRDGAPGPCVVLLDLNMPRMSGLEMLCEMRQDEALADIPVFVLSTSDHASDMEYADRFNINGYFTKPFNDVDLSEAMRACQADVSPGAAL